MDVQDGTMDVQDGTMDLVWVWLWTAPGGRGIWQGEKLGVRICIVVLIRARVLWVRNTEQTFLANISLSSDIDVNLHYVFVWFYSVSCSVHDGTSGASTCQCCGQSCYKTLLVR